MGASLVQNVIKLMRRVAMKNRYSIWRFRYDPFESKAMRRLRSRGGGNKIHLGDILAAVAFILMLKIDLLADYVPYVEWLQPIVAILLLAVGLYLSFRRLAPRTCWWRATWVTGMWATAMTLLPFLLYWLEEFPDIAMAYKTAASSLVIWLAFVGCLLRYRQIRRRSRAEIALMRMRRKRQRMI